MILVTGGAGFIGSNLVGALSDLGARIAVCDAIDSEGKRANIARHRIEQLVEPLGLDQFLARHRDEIEFVYHLGAISSTTETDADLITATNVTLPQTIWRWCAANRVPLVYASSAATYGDGSGGFTDVETPSELARFDPLNLYGRSKHTFDCWVAREVAEGKAAPPQWVGLKFFNVYGPNEYHKGDMRSVVTKAYAGAARGAPVRLFRSHHPDYPDGGQMRDFVYVRDCVEVMLWLRANPETKGLFNLGTGRAQSWLELMDALYSAVGCPLRVEWMDTPEHLRDRYQYYTQAEMGKLRGAGYEGAFVSVEEGIKDYVDRFLGTDDPHR
jgi:ADP-L-glycero-D-manno-heptose 6-epimerase